MKNLLYASVLGLFAVASLKAGFGRGSCPGECPPAPCPEEPICTKTIMVPKTIHVPKCIRVPARKIVIPQPDICEEVPVPPRIIRIKQPPIPQPDIIQYECQPPKIIYHKQPPCIRFECPVGTNENPGCPTC